MLILTLLSLVPGRGDHTLKALRYVETSSREIIGLFKKGQQIKGLTTHKVSKQHCMKQNAQAEAPCCNGHFRNRLIGGTYHI